MFRFRLVLSLNGGTRPLRPPRVAVSFPQSAFPLHFFAYNHHRRSPPPPPPRSHNHQTEHGLIRLVLTMTQAAPQASHGALLGLLLPLYASALALNLPTLGATIGQALLLTARSSGAAFKEAVAYVGAGERQALEGAVRTAILGRGASAGAGDGGGRGSAGSHSRVSGRKLDLSQYSTRG